MSILVPAARQMNTNTAGQTKPAIEPTSTLYAPVANVTSDLEGMLTGGHSFLNPSQIITPLEKATDSVRGPLGGLRPRAGSVLIAGPGGPAHAAAQIQTTARHDVASVTAGAKSAWRKLLGR